MHPTRAPLGMLHGNQDAVAWPFSMLCRVSGPTLFQMTFIAALWVAVFGKCGPPPNLLYAIPASKMNQTDFETHTTLKYNCRPGYSRATSSQTISCKPGGEWSIQISCVKKSCGNPGDLPNGQVEVKTDFSFGSLIEFSCSKGYILIGSTTSYCVIQGKGVTWSDPLPECVIAKCESPPDISNGKHNGGDEDFYIYGSSITYWCDPNFSLSGNASIICTLVNKTVGVWSSSPPTCERIICSKPNVSHGMIISGLRPTYKYKDSVRFACQKGYNLRGSSSIHCGADSSWRPPPPVCELNSCTDIPDIPNAFWVQNIKPKKEDMYPVGAVLRYHCRSGYVPATKEPTAVICQKDLSWSLFKGCKEVCCPVPDPENVRIIKHIKKYPENACTYFYDDTISYKCHDNKVFSSTCKSDGTWYPQTSCYQSCYFPPNIAHGHYTKSSLYFIRPMVTYECDEGYRLVGEASIYCEDSKWTPEAPQCKALCRKPKIANGMLFANQDQYIESENVTIQCYSGFAMLGSQNITCSENGTWYPEVPKCEQGAPTDCEHVFAGKKFMQCLPNSNDVKMALELYKLSLEIELLKLQIDQAKTSILEL